MKHLKPARWPSAAFCWDTNYCVLETRNVLWEFLPPPPFPAKYRHSSACNFQTSLEPRLVEQWWCNKWNHNFNFMKCFHHNVNFVCGICICFLAAEIFCAHWRLYLTNCQIVSWCLLAWFKYLMIWTYITIQAYTILYNQRTSYPSKNTSHLASKCEGNAKLRPRALE